MSIRSQSQTQCVAIAPTDGGGKSVREEEDGH